MFLRLLTASFIFFSALISSSYTQDIRTGEFDIDSTSRQILGDELAQTFAKIIKPDDEFSWNVYVPDNFDPDVPSGIIL